MDADEKRKLPPPTILNSEVQNSSDGKWFYLDLTTHDGQPLRLTAQKLTALRRRLFYYKSLDREVINGLIPPQPQQVASPKVPKPAPPTKPERQPKTAIKHPKPALTLAEIMAQKKVKSND